MTTGRIINKTFSANSFKSIIIDITLEVTMEKEIDKYEEMINTPLEKLILKLSVPAIFSMIIITLYQSADTFFVSKLNAQATAAVGITTSVIAFIEAIGFFLGQGSGNNISKFLGKKDFESSSILASVGFFFAIIIGLLIAVIGNLILPSIMPLLGSTDTITPYAISYLRIILLSSPYYCAALVLNVILRFQGFPKLAMYGLSSGAILNIILDPIFIFVLDLGIAGAAIATIISQFLVFIVLLYFINKNGLVKISIKNFKPSSKYLYLIFNGGIPSLFRQMFISLAIVSVNTSLKLYGDNALAAYAIVNQITKLTTSVVVGLCQGYQPVCGYNFGARKIERVKKGFLFIVKFSTILLVFVSILQIIFAKDLIEIFRHEEEIVRLGTLALILQSLVFYLTPFITASNMMLQTIGYAFSATLIGISRNGMLFLVILVKILPKYLGITGVFLSSPLAIILSFMLTLIIQLDLFRKLD